MAQRQVVLASSNRGKQCEFAALLGGHGIELLLQDSFGIASAAETGTTFEANALLKARHAARRSRLPALADDSGLEVDALGGAPGVYSARYAGPGADDAANNAKLLAALAGIPPGGRRARYRCVLVYLAGPDDPAPVSAVGTWEGCIVDAPRGAGGFGYDPYFWLPDLKMTAAELDPGEKNRLSHRGRAMRKLRAKLEART